LVDTAVKTATTGYMHRRLSKCMEDLSIGYDQTVREVGQHVIQFEYGEDGLDPKEMEGSDSQFLDLNEVLTHVKRNMIAKGKYWTNSPVVESPEQLKDLIPENMSAKVGNIQSVMTNKIVPFLESKLCEKRTSSQSSSFTSVLGLSEEHVKEFINFFYDKYIRAVVEPGTAVGSICSQAIGEPATQMTLKTFHFAGVASMNITQGVPRIQEIINASANISTPIITVALQNPTDQNSARVTKSLLEKTSIEDVTEYIEQVYLPTNCYLLVKISLARLKLLSLHHIDIYKIANKILASKLKILPSLSTFIPTMCFALTRPKTQIV